MTKKVRLASVIVGIIFMLSVIVTGGVMLIGNLSATNQVPDETFGNLFNIDGTINGYNAREFLNKLDYYENGISTGTYTSPQIASLTGNSGAFVFTMGYYVSRDGVINTSKPIKWQATYMKNGYITVWMAQPYTAGYYHYSGTPYTEWEDAVITTGYYTTSGLRITTGNIYQALSNYFPALAEITATPSIAATDWQATQPNALAFDNTSSYYTYYYSILNGLQTNINTGALITDGNTNPFGVAWDSTVYTSDKFWIPSHYEISNISISSESHTNGLWGLTSTDIGGYTRLDTNETLEYNSYYSRSNSGTIRSRNGTSENRTGVGVIGIVSDKANYNYLNGYYPGIRPACHISLEALARVAGYEINASVSDSNATVNKASDIYLLQDDYESIFIFTPNTGYSINSISFNGALLSISETAPATFSATSGAEYMCYRSGNQVWVILRNVRQDSTLIASTQTAVTVSSVIADLFVENVYTTNTGSALTTRITLRTNWSKNVQFKLDSNDWIELKGTNNTGTVGGATYAHNLNGDYIMLELSGLSVAAHTVVVDYYVAIETEPVTGINASASGGTADIQSRYLDDQTIQTVVVPQTNYYVNEIVIDNVVIPVEYYKAEIYGAGGAFTIQYAAKDSDNVLVLRTQELYKDMTVVFRLVNSQPDLQVPPTNSGAGVSGTVVTASTGGEVRLIGFDNSVENDTIRFVAVAYNGYNFAGWSVDGKILEGYGMSADIPYELVKDKIVTAVFEPIQNDDTINDDTDNDQTGEFV